MRPPRQRNKELWGELTNTLHNSLQKRMTDVLNDTVKFYSEDTSRRALNGEVCVYFMEGYDGCDDKSCGVGRYLKPEYRTEEFSANTDTVDLWSPPSFKKYLLDEVSDLPKAFWEDIQTFHDTNGHWVNKLILKNSIIHIKKSIDNNYDRENTPLI